MPAQLSEAGITRGSELKALSSADRHTLHGFRRFKALMIAIPPLVLAACGVNAAPTPGMTTMHTESPIATEPGTVFPSASLKDNPTPSEVTTVTPTEKPTPAGSFNGESFLADLQAGGKALDKYKTPKITLAQLTTAYDALLASPVVPTQKGFQNSWNDCSDTKLDMDTRAGACLSLTNYALRTIHNNPNSEPAEAFGQAVAGYELGSVFTTADRLAFLTQGVSQIVSGGY